MKIVVIGSKKGECPEAEKFGRLAAKYKVTIIYGGGAGLPKQVAKACFAAGGQSIGYPPALNKRELEEHKWTEDGSSKTIYMPECFTIYDWSIRLKFRNVILMQQADAVALFAGGWGTLTEFGINQSIQKPVFVLSGTNGFADELPKLEEKLGGKAPVEYCSSSNEMIVGYLTLYGR